MSEDFEPIILGNVRKYKEKLEEINKITSKLVKDAENDVYWMAICIAKIHELSK